MNEEQVFRPKYKIMSEIINLAKKQQKKRVHFWGVTIKIHLVGSHYFHIVNYDVKIMVS